MHAALKTVKGKVNQLFNLQSQVNVDLLLFPSVSLLIFYFFHTFTFFELYFWILCPGPPEINPELKNQSVSYNSSLQFRCSLSGFPTPEILWTKDGVNLDKKKHCHDSSSEIGRLWSIHLQRQKQRRKQKLNFLDRSGGRYGFHLPIKELESLINLNLWLDEKQNRFSGTKSDFRTWKHKSSKLIENNEKALKWWHM